MLNIALLFGTAVIALSLIIMPMLDDRAAPQRLTRLADNFDMITTGSIKRNDNPTIYLP